MRAIIEKALNTENSEVNLRICIEFTGIVNLILNSKDESELREKFKKPKTDIIHFIWGFGGGHMWVKQIINGEPRQQVIFVQF